MLADGSRSARAAPPTAVAGIWSERETEGDAPWCDQPMTPSTPPNWPHCGHGAAPETDPIGCRGIHVPGHTACLAHLEPGVRGAYFNGLQPGDDVDHRGTTFDEELLRALLAALHDSDIDAPKLGDAEFSEATFSGTARFSGATFSGNTWFSDATFNRTAQFSEATFNGTAGFNRATFSKSAGFRGVSGKLYLTARCRLAAGSRRLPRFPRAGWCWRRP
ncbi:pentapeptide repeat-containing protein [Streptomyces lydicus]|uniref:pentapeptide repeat-containing protein n=1 Tax=Streptomyces lydicus TaxID=47763 RepID=UPI0037A87410